MKRHTRNPEAYEFYLRGLSYFIRFTPEFFQKAIKSFDQAIAIDPRYASAYAGLAESYTEMSFFSSPGEWMPKAREAARKALELDDTLGNAHNSLAVIKMYYDGTSPAPSMSSNAQSLSIRAALIFICGMAGISG